MDIKKCPHCGSDAELEEDRNIFHGQCYSDRYPPAVANQDHGYRIRCVKCGCQTCWWHYKKEAIEIWNKRHLTSCPSRAAKRFDKFDQQFKDGEQSHFYLLNRRQLN